MTVLRIPYRSGFPLDHNFFLIYLTKNMVVTEHFYLLYGRKKRVGGGISGMEMEVDRLSKTEFIERGGKKRMR